MDKKVFDVYATPSLKIGDGDGGELNRREYSFLSSMARVLS